MIIDQLFTRPLFEQAPMASPEQLAYNRLRAQHDGYQAMTGGGGNTAVSRDPAHAAKLATVPAELARMAAALKAKGIDAAAEYDALSGPAAAPVDANQLYEFAPSDDDSNGSDPEELLRRMAAHWWNGTEKQMSKVENTLAAMGWEIGQDDGYDDGGVFVVRAGDEHGGSYISWPHEDLELNEGRKKKKKKTSRSLGRYFFPGYGYYGSGESGEGGGDGGGGESANPGMAEAAQGHTIEAHGVRGMDRRTWHKTFRNTDQMMAWAEKHDAEIIGTRDLEQARHHNLSPARQGVAEGLTEMDKSQTPPGRDTGPRSGPDQYAKSITSKQMQDRALDKLNRAVKDSHKKKDVKEAELDARPIRPKAEPPRKSGVFFSSDEPLNKLNANTYARYYGKKVYVADVYYDQDGGGPRARIDGPGVGVKFVPVSTLTTLKGETFQKAILSNTSTSTPDSRANDIENRRVSDRISAEIASLNKRPAAPAPAPAPAPAAAPPAAAQAAPAPASASSITATAKSAIDTLNNVRKNIDKGSEYTNVYPAFGTDFQNKQYIKDLEAELAKTPNDRVIQAELKKMIGWPKFGIGPLMNKLQEAMVREGRVKELALDLKTMSDADFMKKYGKAKAAIRRDMTKIDETRSDYTAAEMADMLSGKRSQKQVDADAERTRGPNKAPTTKESTQSRTKRLNEKLTTSDTLSRPAAGASSSGKAIDDPDIMGSLRSGPKFDRLGKTGGEPEFDFRSGLVGGETEVEAEPRLMVDPLPDMQKWGGKFATGSAGGDNRFTAPTGWRYVEKGEDPARYGSGEPAAATSALPNLIYDPQSRTLKSADAPASDMTAKSKFKFDRATQSQVPADGSGANANIDNATRDRARAYAAKQNAPATAAKQKVDWKTIYALNKATIGSNPNLIRPGMKLSMPDGSTYRVQPGDNLSKIAAKQSQINELSTEKLAQYKTAAAADAKKADQEGDFKRGDRRFSGIVKATKKQFDNDAKQVDESRAARRALMAQIVNHR